MSQNLPKRSLGDVLSLRHPNHFVLAGANNRNVIITYRFLAAPVQANRDFFYFDCMPVYFNCKYCPSYTRELLECLLRISPSWRNPSGDKYVIHLHFDRLYPTCLMFGERFFPTFSIIPRLIPINSNKKMPLPPFKGCFDVSSLFLLRGEMTFQRMLLNNVL